MSKTAFKSAGCLLTIYVMFAVPSCLCLHLVRVGRTFGDADIVIDLVGTLIAFSTFALLLMAVLNPQKQILRQGFKRLAIAVCVLSVGIVVVSLTGYIAISLHLIRIYQGLEQLQSTMSGYSGFQSPESLQLLNLWLFGVFAGLAVLTFGIYSLTQAPKGERKISSECYAAYFISSAWSDSIAKYVHPSCFALHERCELYGRSTLLSIFFVSFVALWFVRLRVLSGLQRIQPRIGAAVSDQFFMGAIFSDGAVFQHGYQISHTNRAETV